MGLGCWGVDRLGFAVGAVVVWVWLWGVGAGASKYWGEAFGCKLFGGCGGVGCGSKQVAFAFEQWGTFLGRWLWLCSQGLLG